MDNKQDRRASKLKWLREHTRKFTFLFRLDADADVIMLDNFSYPDLRTAVEMIGDNAWTEASGGITLDNIGAIGRIGPDFVSTAAPVHSGRWIDIGLDS